uniref:Alpha-2,8-sialyltransferase 8E-like n=1 Tax=Labrus bergylta TaxID=56723 RepID=A0A3Q3E2R6_9LABR
MCTSCKVTKIVLVWNANTSVLLLLILIQLKLLFSLVVTLMFLGILLIWYLVDNIKTSESLVHGLTKSLWFPRSQLSSRCSGFDKAIITQANTPVGSKFSYGGGKSSYLVSPEVFRTFTKEHPFLNKTWDTCAVVGNGGILTDSRCGERIDSAQFVMRCNLPPLGNSYAKHVGVKTDLVTANPSIFKEKYESLMMRRRPFVESLHIYSSSLLLLPALAFSPNMYVPLCIRAIYSIEDFGSPIRPVFFNPEYMQKLTAFWRAKGLRSGRLSTGIIMASIALEVCENVHLYGFWPFDNHPYGLYDLTNHYYDDRKVKRFHAMPTEFGLLMGLHKQGVLKLHLGDCQH